MKQSKKIATHYLTFKAEILNDDRLSPTDLLLISLITLYDNEKGCFAQNKRLAEFAHCSVGTVSKSIKKLYDYGYIKCNSKNEEHGGRGRIRKVKEDLKSVKSDTLNKGVSPVEKALLPSKKDTHIYKGVKKESKEKKYTIEIEKNKVEKALNIPFPNKWGFYRNCKKEYSSSFLIDWYENDICSLIDLLNRLHGTFSIKLESLPLKDQPQVLFETFKIIINSKPKYFTDSSPSTFLRFWNKVIQQPKVDESIKRIYFRHGSEGHGF
jgi:predicted transcriptional regulator